MKKMEYIELIVAILIMLWNVVVFALYAADKRRAEKNQWRISEATLIICAFLMGGIGAFLGMKILRHKTKHTKFKLLVPLAVLINVGIVILYVLFMM